MNQKDLTKGAVYPTMCLFALPMIVGNILQQGYNVVDTWVVGHYAGSDALAAVGSAFALMTFLTSALLGLCMGSGVVFSLCFGRQDASGLRESICASFFLLSVIAAILTAVSLLGVDALIRWMNIPHEIQTMTKDYMVLIFCGIPAVAVYNYFGAYLKALGNSVVPLIFLGISTIFNIGLDILFVAVFEMGTAGAAAATILSQYISGIGIGIYVLVKNKKMRHALFRFQVKLSSFLEIARYSVLTCLQQSVMNFGILMVQGLVNSFGPVVMAAFAAAVKIDSFAYSPVQDFGNAFSTFVAQNYGAGKKERIREGMRRALVFVFVFCGMISILVCLFARPLMGIFVDEKNQDVIMAGVGYLRIEAAFYFGIGLLFLLYGYYRAVKKPGMSVVLTLCSLGTRVALAYILSRIPAIGVTGIWAAIPIGWALADAVGVCYYFGRMRRK